MWDNFIYYGKINQNRDSHKCTDGAFYKEIIVYLAVCRGTDCSGKRTKRKRICIRTRKIGNKYIVSINNHTEIVKALNAFCKEKGILSGSINGIGAIGELTLRFFNPKTKAYDDKTFREQMEISNLTGNISSMNEQVYLHLHITVGRSDYSALAGHLLSAIQNGAGEFVVEDYSERISRTYNPDLGLNIYDFER